ncbi:MAG: ABC transporter substrate-binding protein, partial [Acidimicrobiales bacterium]
LTLVACAGGDGGGLGDGGGEEPRARPASDVVVAVGEDIWPLTGRGPTSKSLAAGDLSVGVYEPLVALGADFEVRPGLAERWELLDGGTWRFHLRRGVTWHDGRPFVADDVVWSWTERQFYPRSVSATLGPGSVRKVDDHTVDFTPLSTNLRLPEQLVHPEGAILPNGGHSDDDPPVGTGPYRVVEYRPRQRVVVEAYPGYWGPPAKVARLTFVFTPDPAERADALRQGRADVAANPAPAALSGLERGGYRVVRAPRGFTHVLSANSTGPPPHDATADPAVRRAAGLALDRTAYVGEGLAGEGEPSRWLSPPAVLGAAAGSVAPLAHDPAGARRLLDEAG